MFSRTHYNCLLDGFIHLDSDGLSAGSLWSSDRLQCELAGAWQFLSPQLLREWIQVDPGDQRRIGGAGYRPAAWWVFDARHRRERVDGGVHPYDCPKRHAKVAAILAEHPQSPNNYTGFYYGVPSCWIVGDPLVTQYETQPQYIDRLGLWLPGEQELYAEQQRRAAERERLAREAEGKL